MTDFFADTRVDLEQVLDALTRMDRGAPAIETIPDLKRGVEAIRSRAALFGLVRIAAVARAMELTLVRLDEDDPITPADARELRRAGDRVARLTAMADRDTAENDVGARAHGALDAGRLQERLAAETASFSADPWSTVEYAAMTFAAQMGKSIDLAIDESARAAPRPLLNALGEVFGLLVRYAIVHSVEPNLMRHARGKRSTGVIRISALPAGADYTFTLDDDGAGLNLDRLRARAKVLGVAAHGDESDVDLVFAPRLSWMGERSGESGLDRVRTDIQRLGGAITARNAPGRGLSFDIRAPAHAPAIQGAA